MSTRSQTQQSLKTGAAPPAVGAGGLLQRKCGCGTHTVAGGECDSCRGRRGGALRRDALSAAPPGDVPAVVHKVLSSAGRPLDAGARSLMETRFGHDFSHVRVHTDARAAESARAVDALAYTVGRQIVFAAGQYAPGTAGGQSLLAHELTHVMQQGSSGVAAAGPPYTIVPEDDASEREADARAAGAGRARVAARLARPALQRQPAAKPIREAVCETTANPTPAQPGDCTYKEPANCPTYEGWVRTFSRLKTFRARTEPHPAAVHPDTEPHVFNVLGAEPAARDPKTAGDKGAPAPITSQHAAEKFIDHPTDEWVKTCLPENLRVDAYQLPADCADIAVILRHVWLAAHNRTEKFGKWTIGSKTGKDEHATVKTVIGEVYTGNVAVLINPYSDLKGQPLRSFRELEPLLHAGDVLVWAHFDDGFDKPRTGGHTHTISSVTRDPSGKITGLGVLQGNQPIFGSRDPAEDDKTKIINELKLKDTKGTRKVLGDLPGRRIEASGLSAGDAATGRPSDFQSESLPSKVKGGSPVEVWKWGAETLLVAAGPPKAAPRPAMKAEGKSSIRRLSDWVPALRAATGDTLPGVFDAALLEARAFIEGGRNVTDEDVALIGRTAGEAVWSLAKKAKGTGEVEHFKVVMRMRAVIQELGASSNQPVSLTNPLDATSPRMVLLRLFRVIDESFNLAARGSSNLDFARRGVKPEKLVKTLLTGFDPFNLEHPKEPPRPGEWNPSGAAVKALDGERIKADKGVVAAVESVVLPNSYADFNSGLVEKIVKPHANDVDAVLTVSLDPDIKKDGPVRLERYAIGGHILLDTLEIVPIAAADGGGAGPAIIETDAPLEQIADETAGKAKKGAAAVPPRPVFGDKITFFFANAAVADSALMELGLPPEGTQEVVISDHAALQQIIKTMSSVKLTQPQGPVISFKANGKEFRAFVRRGPGGNFFSNESSFRVLRLLGETQSPKNPISFHTHTEQGNLIPQDVSTPAARKEQKKALKSAAGIIDRLVTTLRRMIKSVAGIVAARRTS